MMVRGEASAHMPISGRRAARLRNLARVLDIVAEAVVYVVRVHVWALRHALAGKQPVDGPQRAPLLTNGEVAHD